MSDDNRQTQRIYVLSWAPSYDQTASGGLEWVESWDAILDMTSRGSEHCVLTSDCDYRIITLDLPWGLTAGEITSLLDGYLSEVIEVPDPREEMGELQLKHLLEVI